MVASVRMLLTGGAVLAGGLLGAGCEKPTPLVTVVAAGTTVHAEASGWCVRGACRDLTREIPVVSVKSGQLVGIDVDRSVAKGDWAVSLVNPSNGQEVPITRAADTHFQSFYPPQVARRTDVRMRVSVQRSETGRDKDRVGFWAFTLRIDP